jgi:hypothetical protein
MMTTRPTGGLLAMAKLRLLAKTKPVAPMALMKARLLNGSAMLGL